tara:strand:- start:386 stop:1420 length:1035 start_codon:yes stop_codon:yes gene_type:complete
MLRLVTKITLLIFTLTVLIQPLGLNADSHTPNMNFNFLPKFVHYQGSVLINGKSLSEIETGIDFIEVEFINQKQSVNISGKQVEIDEGQFVFTTYYGDPIEGKFHIDIGPGVPERTIFDVYIAGIKANESIIFDPTPKNGCPVSNCFSRTFNLVIDTLPTPTPTPVPPTPTPIPTVNPSFYSGQIIIGSSAVPDGVQVFAKIDDYVSEIVKTSEGKFTLTVNPRTINYVGQDVYLIIQGNQSMNSIQFLPDEFITDANFLFSNFDIDVSEAVSTPGPEKIIVVATPTPEIDETLSQNGQSVSLNDESGGCSGGGSSKISIFSILTSIFLLLIFKKTRKLKISSF